MSHRAPTGRGAQSGALSSRFNLPAREADGDWRDVEEAVDGPADKLRTTVTEEHPKTILSFNRSPDIPFDRSINAYRGCEHGCIYCFAKPGYRPAPIAMGTNTDPYQPIEARYRITRAILELCLETRHPVILTTKSDRCLRDLDLLAEMARHRLVAIGISVTSLDPRLSRLLEPRAASPAKRLATLERLTETGIPTHVSVAPVIPAITDEFIEAILAEAARRGVRSASWIMIRLPHEVAPLFREWLATHYPDRAAKVMSIIRSARGGRDNDPDFFSRMKPDGVWATLLRRRFRLACKRNEMDAEREFTLDCSQFRRPSTDGQLSLL